MNRVSRIVAAIVTTLSLSIVGVVAPVFASPSAIPNPNPPGTSGVLNNQLPTCSGIGGTKADDMAGQGWLGDWQMPMQIGGRTSWAVLMLPCWSSGFGGSARLWIMGHSIDTAASGEFVDPATSLTKVTYFCDNAEHELTGLPATSGSQPIPSGEPVWYLYQSANGGGFCQNATSTITKIAVAWKVHFNGNLISGTAVWLPSTWINGDPKTKPSTIGAIPFPGGAQETPVICLLGVDSTDVVTILGTFLTAFGGWVKCLFTPTGWDRSGRVNAAYNESGISRTGAIIGAVIPSSSFIVCGTILTIAVFAINFTLSSCGISGAVPTWIKVAIGTVTIVAMLYLFIRRVQWAVVK